MSYSGSRFKTKLHGGIRMKSVKTLSIALLTTAVVGTQLQAMNGMGQSVPTQVPFGMRFIDRVKNGGIAQRSVFVPAFTMTSPEIQVQQELLDQSAGLPAQEALSTVSFAQRAQDFAKNAFNSATEKAQTLKSAVAQRAHAFGHAVAEKAQKAYNSDMVQQGMTKVAQFGHAALAQGKVYAQSLADKSQHAMDYVKENPKVVAGVAVGAIATYGLYKFVSDFVKNQKKQLEDMKKLVVDYPIHPVQPVRVLTQAEQDALSAQISSEDSVIDPAHAAHMEQNRA
jgi:hypothetical protein